MIALQTVDCSDCKGKCCRHMVAPPFTLMWNGYETLEPVEECHNWIDYEHWMAMPQSLKTEYRDRAMARRGRDEESPCHWLTQSGRCANHEFRPDVCRDFEVGGEDCMETRKRVQL